MCKMDSIVQKLLQILFTYYQCIIFKCYFILIKYYRGYYRIQIINTYKVKQLCLAIITQI